MHIPTDYAQVNYIFSGTGLPNGAQVAIGVDNSGSHLSAAAIAGIAGAAWHDNIAPGANNHATLDKVQVKKGPNATGEFYELAMNDPGTNNSGDLIPNVAAIVRKGTGVGGRAGRGRSYWPVLGESDIANGGTLTSGALSGLTGAFAAFRTQLDTGDTPMVLLHAVGVSAPLLVLTYALEGRCGTQRRRLRK